MLEHRLLPFFCCGGDGGLGRGVCVCVCLCVAQYDMVMIYLAPQVSDEIFFGRGQEAAASRRCAR